MRTSMAATWGRSQLRAVGTVPNRAQGLRHSGQQEEGKQLECKGEESEGRAGLAGVAGPGGRGGGGGCTAKAACLPPPQQPGLDSLEGPRAGAKPAAGWAPRTL